MAHWCPLLSAAPESISKVCLSLFTFQRFWHGDLRQNEHGRDQIEVQMRRAFLLLIATRSERCLEKMLGPPRQPVSKSHPTHVHLVTQHEEHWAAVLLSIQPFYLPTFLGRTFYSCYFQNTLCCQTIVESISSIDLISNVVQQICNVYYQPIQWNFSTTHWYVQRPFSPSVDSGYIAAPLILQHRD